MNPLPETDPKRAIAYRRVSSAEQGKAYGPDAQAKAIRGFAHAEGLEIVADFSEDVSGTVPLDQREGLRAALAAAYQHGAGTLIVARRDRLARDEFAAHDALRAFKAAGVRVLYADGGNGADDGALLLDGISHVIAAHERRAIVARLRAGRDAKAARHPASRAQGGRVPFGYRRTREGLEIDPEQAAEVRRIYAMARSGKSIREIAAEVGRRPTVVERILRRPAYKQGDAKIIDPRLWNATQEALAKRRKVAAN